jgi:hypothetical protein
MKKKTIVVKKEKELSVFFEHKEIMRFWGQYQARRWVVYLYPWFFLLLLMWIFDVQTLKLITI